MIPPSPPPSPSPVSLAWVSSTCQLHCVYEHWKQEWVQSSRVEQFAGRRIETFEEERKLWYSTVLYALAETLREQLFQQISASLPCSVQEGHIVENTTII